MPTTKTTRSRRTTPYFPLRPSLFSASFTYRLATLTFLIANRLASIPKTDSERHPAHLAMAEHPFLSAHDAQTRAAQRVGARDLRVARHPVVRVCWALLSGKEREDGRCGWTGVGINGRKSAMN